MTLLYLAIAYLLGIALGRLCWDLGWFGCTFPDWIWLGLLVLLPLSPLANRLPTGPQRAPSPMRWPAWAGFEVPQTGASPALVAALTVTLGVGIFRYAATPLTPCWTPMDLAYYNLPADRAFDKKAPELTITGYINSYPLLSDTKQRLHVVAHAISTGANTPSTAVVGTLRLTTGTQQRYRYGEPVRLQGRLVTPPDFEDFSYREHLARKQIHSLLYNVQIEALPGALQGRWLDRQLFALRGRGEQLLNRLLPEPYAALANGMLLGIEAGIPDELYEQFNLTGTSHTIVISGSNISILAAVLLGLGQKLFGRRRALWPTLIGIGCYALLVGGDAAVLRAAFMGGLFVTATAINRRSTALVSLAVACWVMTLFNPLTLWDVGFQLSSAATAGLILFTPGFTAFVERRWPAMSSGILTATELPPTVQRVQTMMYGLVQDGLLVTIAANITTLPLVLYYFDRLSVVSLLTNLIIAPVQPFIMLWGSGAILVGVVGLPWLAWLILLIPWLSLVWTVAAVQWTAALPGASLEIAGYGAGGLLITYLVIGLIHWRIPLVARVKQFIRTHTDQWSARLVGAGAVGALCVATILIWATLLSQPDGRLHVYFLDIGQGDGIFIETPSGRQVLVDGGASPQKLMSELGEVMGFWDRAIDLLVLSHPDGDHMNAQIEVPARFDVTTALNTAFGQRHPDSERWQAAMAAAGVDVQLQQQGGWIDLGDGVALWTLWPPTGELTGDDADNENSLVMKLVYGEFSVLLTGDAGRPSEGVWVQDALPLASRVLKVGHHGSTTSTGAAFVAQVNPQVAVIQSGADNRYGHPHLETLHTLDGRLILRNDTQGRVHIWSDGQSMWIETEDAQ